VKDNYLMVMKSHLSLKKVVMDQRFLINLPFFLKLNQELQIFVQLLNFKILPVIIPSLIPSN